MDPNELDLSPSSSPATELLGYPEKDVPMDPYSNRDVGKWD